MLLGDDARTITEPFVLRPSTDGHWDDDAISFLSVLYMLN